MLKDKVGKVFSNCMLIGFTFVTLQGLLSLKQYLGYSCLVELFRYPAVGACLLGALTCSLHVENRKPRFCRHSAEVMGSTSSRLRCCLFVPLASLLCQQSRNSFFLFSFFGNSHNMLISCHITKDQICYFCFLLSESAPKNPKGFSAYPQCIKMFF